MRCVGFSIAALLLGAGCVASQPAGGADEPIRVGAWVSYLEVGGDTTFEVVVGGKSQVQDPSSGRTLDAWLVHRWTNMSETGRLNIDALDADGRYLWSALCFDSACREVAVATSVAGSPGFLGRVRLAQESPPPGPDGCRRLLGSDWLPPRALRLSEPFDFPEGGDATFCQDPWPDFLEIPTIGEFDRVASRAGSGGDVGLIAAPDRPPTPQAEAVAWNGRFPSPEVADESFPLEEAWDWLASNDADFASFLERPGVHLRSVERPHSSGGGPGNFEESTTMRLLVEDTVGDVLAVEIVRDRLGPPSSLGLQPPLNLLTRYTVLSKEQYSATPNVVIGEVPPLLVPPSTVTERHIAWVGESRIDTAIISEGARGFTPVPTTSTYLYRILTRPPGSSGGVAHLGIYDARDGILAYAVADRSLFFGE